MGEEKARMKAEAARIAEMEARIMMCIGRDAAGCIGLVDGGCIGRKGCADQLSVGRDGGSHTSQQEGRAAEGGGG